MTFSDAEWRLEHAACALLTLDATGTIVAANQDFCTRFGYSIDKVIGTGIIRYLTPGGRVFSQTHWFPLMQMQGSVAELKLDFRHANGDRIPTLLNARRRVQDSTVFDEVAVFVVTDRHKYEQALRESRQKSDQALLASERAYEAQVKAEQQLKAANELLLASDKFKDAFLVTLAHELRNPLAAIANIVSILDRFALDDARLDRPSEILRRQVVQMTSLVSGLMDAARVGQGKIELHLERLDLNTLLSQELDSLMPSVIAAGHAISVDVETQPLMLNADAIRVAQIIQNLLNNAIKYTPTGGRILVRTRLDGQEAVLQVRDNGIGIPLDQQNRIFEMFGQLSAGHELAQGGLGIGLALIHGLMELHGGTISVKSDGLHQGSEFIARFPLCSLAEA